MRPCSVVRLVFFMLVLLAWPAAAPAEDKPRDPWIAQAVREIADREPTEAEWDKYHWGGVWTSYDDLANKVRVKLTNQGAAYIFVKPDQAGTFGHFGWGFLRDDGRYLCGSTENPFDKDQWWRAVNIGHGDAQGNGYWSRVCDTEQAMLLAMSRAERGGSSGYWHYKSTLVMQRNSTAAEAAAEYCRTAGFGGVNRNCLDQGYYVLESYGVDKEKVMPWKQTHPAPNEWFKAFGKIKGTLSGGYWAHKPDEKDYTSVYGHELPEIGAAIRNCATNDAFECFDEDPKGTAGFNAETVFMHWLNWSWTQQWYFNAVPGEADTYTICCRIDPSRVLDVPRGEKTDGLGIVMWSRHGDHGGDNQRWLVRSCGTDSQNRTYYQIMNKATGLVLTQPVVGRQLVQAPERSDWRQRWYLMR